METEDGKKSRVEEEKFTISKMIKEVRLLQMKYIVIKP